MVTPRKPNAKRGRPPLAWRDDPDRMAIAFMLALDALEMSHSMRSVTRLAAALQLSKATYSEGKIGYQVIAKPGTPTLSGRADTLRTKYRKATTDPTTAKWLKVMAGIFMLIIGAKDWDKVRDEALLRAADPDINEQDFVRDLVSRLRN